MFAAAISRQKAASKSSIDDDDDNISLTSTQESEYSSDHEFAVERILAEKKEKGGKRYLLEWADYPIERAAWEPEDSIVDLSMLQTWKTRKSREASGIEKPFDVEGYEAKLKKLKQEKEARIARRQFKRSQLGIANRHTEEGQDESDEEAIVADPVHAIADGKAAVPHQRATHSNSNALVSGLDPKMPQITSRLVKSPTRQERLAAVSGPSSKTNSNVETSTSKRATFNIPKAPPVAPRPKPVRAVSLSEPARSNGQVPAGRSKGAPPGSLSIPKNPKNVFAKRSVTKRRPTLLENSSDPSKQTKHFTNMRVVRKAELAGRDRDIAPDPTAIGGLFKPGDNPKLQPIKSADIRRPPVNIYDRRDSRPGDDNTSDAVDPQGSRRPSNPIDLPGTGKKICYFWNLHKGADMACSKGINCFYLHDYMPGASIAEPPPGHSKALKQVDGPFDYSAESDLTADIDPQPEGLSYSPSGDVEESSKQYTSEPLPTDGERTKGTFALICWYWHKDGRCIKHSNCDFLHTNDSRFPLSIPSKYPGNQLPPIGYAPKTHKYGRCPFWVNKNACIYSNNCQFLHSDDSSIPVAKMPETCKYWNHGKCKFTAEKCMYLHENLSLARAPGTEDFHRLEDRENAAPPSLSKSTSSDYQKKPAPKKTVSFGPTESATFFDEPEIMSNASEPTEDLTNFDAKHSTETIAMPPKVLKKVSVDDYRRKGALKVLKDRRKMVLFGGSGDQQAVPLDVGELGPDTKWRGAFAALSDIKLDIKCVHGDISTQFQIGRHRVIWDGSLVPFDMDDFSVSNVVDKVASQMKLLSSGLLACLPEFNILVYPNAAEEWNFLSENPYPEEVRLRYILFCSDFDISSFDALRTTVPQTSPKVSRVSYRKSLVETVHGLSRDRLRIPGKKEPSPNFYLMFPTYAKDVSQFFANYLEASFSACKVYNSDVEGSWKSFINLPSGTVIIHGSIADELDELPYLQSMLRSSGRQFQFFYVTGLKGNSLTFPSLLSPLYQDQNYMSIEEPANSNIGKIGLERLFPHGGVIFLTPSFLAAEPERTYEVLCWFFGKTAGHGKIDKATPGTWKIALCWDFIGYMHGLAIAKSEERDRFLEENHDNPSKDAEASERGLGYENCLTRFKIHGFLNEVYARGELKSVKQHNSYDSDCTVDFYNDPVVCLGQPWTGVDHDDEKLLTEMFAAWSLSRLDILRRFVVMGTGPKSILKARRLKLVVAGTDCPRQTPLHTQTSRLSTSAKDPEFSLNREPVKTSAVGMTSQKQNALAIAARLGSQHSKNPPDVGTSPTSNNANNLMDIDSEILHLIASARPPDTRLRLVTSDAPFNEPYAASPSSGSISARPRFSPALSSEAVETHNRFSKNPRSSPKPVVATNRADTTLSTPASNAGSRVVSNAASPVRRSSLADIMPMDIDSDLLFMPPETEGEADMMDLDTTLLLDDAKEQQPETEYKMLQFEGTKTWYERTKLARGGLMWEHLAVMSLEDWGAFGKWVSLKH
ncbi:Chromo [Glarea lozoyensis ATCC 20868]|uniref:Chromo n=1 Tax=Glarea lozoyensis (strain ATCC 20868 / MF5171) TaxID=1116229 RepID=S3CKN2_GLAL2|nr:Chromo [Glarea lozoyensis ATCC 20868]EPE27092.1 Chromo [Glarea lozoyensis ATCC 20868]